MIGECIECGSTNTELVDSETGNFEKVCHDCGYVGGPYISDQISEGDSQESKSECSGQRGPMESKSDEQSQNNTEDDDVEPGATTLEDF